MTEQFYDEEIAPVLLELAKKCDEKSISLISAVEFAPNDIGGTYNIKKPGIEMKVAYLGCRCLGNVDNLIMSLLKDAKKNGHNSIYLKILLDMGH